MKVEIWLQKTSQSLLFNAESTYQKGDMFCVKVAGIDQVYKYPIASIFCVVESEFKHSHKEK